MGNSDTPLHKATIFSPKKRKRRDKSIPLFRDERILRKKLIHAKNEFKTDYVSDLVKSYKNPFENVVIDLTKENVFYTKEFHKVMGFSKAAKQLITRLFYKEMKYRKYTLTIGDKLLAIAILQQKPKGYRLLRTIFKLPAPETLVNLLRYPTRKTEVHNNKMMKLLRKKAQNKIRDHRLCSLLFGQVKLKTKPTHKKIKSSLADHAQIFMIKGLKSQYKQIVACSLSRSSKTGPELAKQIKTVIFKLRKVGFRVLATISDHSYPNRTAIKHLKEESKRIYQSKNKGVKRNVFLINPQQVIPIYDPPQLLLALRNQFVTKDIVYTKDGKKGTAKFEHILRLTRESFIKKTSIKDKLNKKHLALTKVDKVCYASELFCYTLGAYLAFMSDKYSISTMPTESRETGHFIIFLNNLFDSLNGKEKQIENEDNNELLKPVKSGSQHRELWRKAIEVFKTMSFVGDGEVSVPEIQCWIESLEGVEELYWTLRRKYHVESLWMRRVNMDPLTNFIMAVRGSEYEKIYRYNTRNYQRH